MMRWLRCGGLLGLAALAGCLVHLPRADEGPYPCARDADCIGPYTCRDGFCTAAQVSTSDGASGDDGGGDRSGDGSACVPDCGTRKCGIETVCNTSCGQCTEPGAGSCSPSGVCVACEPEKACDDGNPCTYGDTCTETGFCLGTSVTCNSDPGVCGLKRTCDGTAACHDKMPPSGVVCNDGDLCTYDDQCDGLGSCRGTLLVCESDPATCGPKRSCNGTAACVVSYPGGTVQCDDGNACTYNERCSGTGACTGGIPAPCSDDPGTCGVHRQCNGQGGCTISAPGSTTSCDDGNLCTYNDVCNGSGGCLGTPISCAGAPDTCAYQSTCNGTSQCTSFYPGHETACWDPYGGCSVCDGYGGCPYSGRGCFSTQCSTCVCASDGYGPACACSARGNCENGQVQICGPCIGCGTSRCCLMVRCRDCYWDNWCGSSTVACVPC